MKFLITGGTGFVGQHLGPRLAKEGNEVIILTRKKTDDRDSRRGVTFLQGDPTQGGAWQEAVSKCDGVINLAGTSIFGRWSEARKRDIRESRILTTRHLVEAIPSKSKTALFSTSAVGYYGFHQDEELVESSPPGDDFLANLSVEWEREAMKAQDRAARVVITRFGIIMGKGGGALEQMVTPFKWFVGGPIGDGLQWFSWIHIEDLVEAFLFLVAHPNLTGPFNLTAPHPVRNRDLSHVLGSVLGRPSWMPAPAFMIRLVLGEFGSVILQGQRVLPRRLLENGFSFRYPEVEGALRDLLG